MNNLNDVYYVDCKAGGGKTYQAIRHAHKMASKMRQKFLFVVPSRVLVEQIEDSLRELQTDDQRYELIGLHSNNTSSRTVTSEITERIKKAPSSRGMVMIITHAAFLKIPHFHNPMAWNIIIDETMPVLFEFKRNVADTHGLVTDYIDVRKTHDSDESERTWYQLSWRKGVEMSRNSLREDDNYLRDFRDTFDSTSIASNSKQDEVYAIFAELTQWLSDPEKYDVLISADQWDRLMASQTETTDEDEYREKHLPLHVFAVLRPGWLLNGTFRTVTVMSALFKETLMYKLWSREPYSRTVRWVPHRRIKDFRYQEHENGHLVDIVLLMGSSASKSLLKRKLLDSETTVSEKLIHDTNELLADDTGFIVCANNDVPDDAFSSSDANRVKHNVHGLNCYDHLDNVAYLSAIRPSSQFVSFASRFGITQEDIVTDWSCLTAYQVTMRCSIRDIYNERRKAVVVIDPMVATFLSNQLPDSRIAQEYSVDYMDIEHETERAGTVGRPLSTDIGRPLTSGERKKISRLRTTARADDTAYLKKIKDEWENYEEIIQKYEDNKGRNDLFFAWDDEAKDYVFDKDAHPLLSVKYIYEKYDDEFRKKSLFIASDFFEVDCLQGGGSHEYH